MPPSRPVPATLKRPIAASRVRRIPSTGFGWIDRRLVTAGHLAELTQAEALLYFFLCMVADGLGLSFFGDHRLCAELRLSNAELDRARTDLDRRGLILHRHPLYQVLPVPVELQPPKQTAPRPRATIAPSSDDITLPRSLAHILRLPPRS